MSVFSRARAVHKSSPEHADGPSVGWPWYPAVDVHEESQQESSDLILSEESSLFTHSLEHLLGIRDIQVHIPCFSGVRTHVCLKEVPLPVG